MSSSGTEPTETPQGKKGFNFVDIFFICLVLFGGIYLYNSFHTYQEKQKPKTPEQVRAEKIEKQFSSFDGSHYKLTRLIKEAMHYPDSYEHVKTRHECDTYTCETLLVRTSYRGQNAFGATVLNRVTARVDMDGNLLEVVSQE